MKKLLWIILFAFAFASFGGTAFAGQVHDKHHHFRHHDKHHRHKKVAA
jgi:hypothetical protein